MIFLIIVIISILDHIYQDKSNIGVRNR